jgi:pyridoxal phosphate enzyme (YggS family)
MSITSNILSVLAEIRQAEIASHRPPDSVQLLAVSKQHPPSSIREAFLAGQHHFGENYVQEALAKKRELVDLAIHWHYIGHIQSNKANAIAREFDWVHTLSSHTTATKLNHARSDDMPLLNVCMQVNFDAESSKGGVRPEDLPFLARHIQTLPHLTLRGLMVIPKPALLEEAQYQSFLRVTQCLQSLNQQLNLSMDTLSMGMSADFKAAIQAGSTLIRLGTLIFGER